MATMLRFHDKFPVHRAQMIEALRMEAEGRVAQQDRDSTRRLAAIADLKPGPEQYAALLRLVDRAVVIEAERAQVVTLAIQVEPPVPTASERRKVAYAALRARGVCVRCKEAQAEPGKSRCEACRVKEGPHVAKETPVAVSEPASVVIPVVIGTLGGVTVG